MAGFDAAFSVEHVLPQIKRLSPPITDIHRYYGGSPSKDLMLSEAQAIIAAGYRIGTQFEAGGDALTWFTAAQGIADARLALAQAANCRQPVGSAIYFCFDLDMTQSQIGSHAVPYATSVSTALLRAGYRRGAYGSGLLGYNLFQAKLIDFFWLAQAKGWAGYAEYKHLAALIQGPEANYGLGAEVDTDKAVADWGGWNTFAPVAPAPVVTPAVIPTRSDIAGTVKTLQAELKAIGLYGGALDGVPGAGTMDALNLYQRGAGELSTGV